MFFAFLIFKIDKPNNKKDLNGRDDVNVKRSILVKERIPSCSIRPLRNEHAPSKATGISKPTLSNFKFDSKIKDSKVRNMHILDSDYANLLKV